MEEVTFMNSLNKSYCANSSESLQSHYGNLESFVRVVNCKSENHCRIINENRVSNLLNTYLVKVKHIENRVACLRKSFQEALRKGHVNNASDLDDFQLNSNLLGLARFPVIQNEKNPLEISNIGSSPENSVTPVKNGINFRITDADTEKTHSRKNNELPMEKETLNAKVELYDKYCDFSADRPHRCTICMMAFKRKLHLKRHFLVAHTEQKNYICNVCGKSFSRKDYLDKHAAGHVKRNFKLKLLKEGVVVRTKIHLRNDFSKK